MDTWNACLEVDARNYKPRPTKESEISLFGGLLRCMDCGFKMRYAQETHDYPKKGKVKYVSYLCGCYARSGKGACSAHIIYLNPLSELVLGDIRHRAKRVLENEDRVRQELMDSKAKQGAQQMKADKTTLKATEKRLAELERLTQAPYEDNVSGKIDDARFSKMSKRYKQEQGENAAKVKALKLELKKTEGKRMDVDQFLESVRRYTNAVKVTKRMVTELIDHIEVYHAEKDADGVATQRVTIFYNCIGAFDVPDRRKIPEADILMETRKGVAVNYTPAQTA